ncbi:TMAO reductase system periplasmic protein TorT [Neoaquamicrobium sediminum]|uniref:TMAO reductase system periplasmic protein TorT n=1 Tax=Neoaquamicrobium sediminum TaxID=1849104 RepID=UPI0036231D6D
MRAGLIAGTLVCLSCSASFAADWWPAKVYNEVDGAQAAFDYIPLTKAEKKWHLCVLFPHVKDSMWVAAAYGVVEEAKRLGVKLTLLQAGGYENLPRQISQFDDCVAARTDAIVTGAISEAGMAKKFEEGLSKNIPQIMLINPVADAKVTAKVSVDYPTLGRLAGEYILSNHTGSEIEVAAFPGPQGSGWAEGFNQGFEEALSGSSAKIVDTKWGDTGVAVQLRLVEDSLQTYPDVSVLWGAPPAIEAAVGAVVDAGLDNKVELVSSYENQAMYDLLRSGDVKAFPTLAPVLEARIAIDTAVRVLESKEFTEAVMIVPEMLSVETVDEVNLDNIFAPRDWQPVYTVD